jgi:alginate O-acetyltransferase complex protein AlgI
LGLYISFFPQLIAGPIVRYVDISNQIQMRTVGAQKFSEGCIRFMVGFSKKVLIADQLAPYVDKIFALHGVSAPCAWLGITAYALQIYFDFSGYSDMAIGLGKMFGFDFLENFNYPYIAKSIKDFWRRWHISLSQWFRDYVYIPLGGNKVGCMRLIVNLLIVWSLTGFWHGASWNFIIWGLYYFVFLVMERFFLGRLLEKLPSSIQHLYAVVVILFGWIFFRETGLCYSMEYIQNLFIVNDNSWVDFVYIIDWKFLFCFLIGLLFSMPIVSVIRQKNKKAIEIAYCGLVFIVFIIAIAFLLGTNFSPFLYFRF